MNGKLRIGYIPLVDAVTLLVAVDAGFTADEGLAVELVREVSWSNVRDKLNIGIFDAAHLLSPLAIASSLGIGHVRVPLLVPFNLAINGNAMTVSPRVMAALSAAADGNLDNPMVSVRALARVAADRKARGSEPLTFGMTFPFSNHNYQWRFWMAAGGIDPDDDVRLVVLPPPYMVESLASGHVDGFCVGAPWNSVAVDAGIGHILHLGCEIVSRASEKVLAVRERWAAENPELLQALVRALARAGNHLRDNSQRRLIAEIVANRIGVDPELVSRTLSGNVKISPDGAIRTDNHHILVSTGDATRPDRVQAAWLYAQMVRWRQSSFSDELCAAAQAVFRPDLYDGALGVPRNASSVGPPDGIGAFIGPQFEATDVARHLAVWSPPRIGRPRLSVVH